VATPTSTTVGVTRLAGPDFHDRDRRDWSVPLTGLHWNNMLSRV
jgi:hypothetical protein